MMCFFVARSGELSNQLLKDLPAFDGFITDNLLVEEISLTYIVAERA